MRTRMLIVDDHDGFRIVAREMLEADGFTVIGEAADGTSAIELVAQLRPDVVLLDVHLPDVDGFYVACRLAELADPPVVILISSRPLADLRRRAESSPVAGFLAKHELSGAAVTAVAKVPGP